MGNHRSGIALAMSHWRWLWYMINDLIDRDEPIYTLLYAVWHLLSVQSTFAEQNFRNSVSINDCKHDVSEFIEQTASYNNKHQHQLCGNHSSYKSKLNQSINQSVLFHAIFTREITVVTPVWHNNVFTAQNGPKSLTSYTVNDSSHQRRSSSFTMWRHTRTITINL